MSAVPDALVVDGSALRGFDRMWSELEPIGRDARTGGYRRYAWTPEDRTLREWFAAACADRGLEVVEDRAGNQWAWWGDPYAQRADGHTGGVAVGSHLDSVPDGGAFDGPLGVVSALAAVDALQAAGLRPRVPLAVTNFGDEEGARFGIACAGSRLLTGALPPERALALADADGTTMADALRVAGRDPSALAPDPELLGRIRTFVELHVEQGRALGDANRFDQHRSAVAVGSDIWPHGRWQIEVPGTANHAGTTRLEDRQDALLTTSALVLAVRAAAARYGCVATVGRLRVEPNGVNAIPSHVTASLDARGPDEGAVRRLVEDLRGTAGTFGATVTEQSWTGATRFDPHLVERLAELVGPDTPVLGTGAGHDAGILAAAAAPGISSAMLFVRNPTGVSHSPAEHAEVADCHAGVVALTRVLAELTGATA